MSTSAAGCGVAQVVKDGGTCSSNTITKSSLNLFPDLCEEPSGSEDTILLYEHTWDYTVLQS